MIVIVGAGLAGLSAAYKLISANCTDFLIVEAQANVGGRVQSAQIGDTRVDLGAQWLHGERSNPIYSWLEALDCIEGPEEEEMEFEGLFVSTTGERAQPRWVARVLEVLLDAKSHLYEFAKLSSNACRPADVFHRSIQEAAIKCPVLREAPRELVDMVERWFFLYETIDNSCNSLEDLSIKAYSGWSDYDNGRMVRLKGGWPAVADKLVDVIGRDKLLLNAPVERINWQGGEKIRVKVRNQHQDIECDQVLLTVPIGVLKKNISGPLLSPRLSDSRRQRIARLGFGPVNKVFLQFSTPYLQEERGLKLLQSKSRDRTSKPGWLEGVLCFDLVDGAPDILLVWVGGVGAEEMEQVSDQELGNGLLQLLRECIPHQPPPALISITRSRWSSNPHIGGAYSYPSVASVDCDMSDLWAPLCDENQVPKIMFAGEATAGEAYATAHGAIMSGWREADRILQSTPAGQPSCF